jgi:hypothetical protein
MLWLWIKSMAATGVAMFVILGVAAAAILPPVDNCRISMALVAALVSGNPAICSTAMTDRWLEESYNARDVPLTQRCQDLLATGYNRPDLVRVTDIEIDGATAQAVIQTEGSAGDATSRVALVNAGGWKVDQMLDTDLDEAAFAADQMERAKLQTTPQARHYDACIYRFAEKHTDAVELELMVLSGDTSLYIGAWPECRQEFVALATSPEAIRERTLSLYSGSVERCVSERLHRFITPQQMHRFFVATIGKSRSQPQIRVAWDAAVTQCADT